MQVSVRINVDAVSLNLTQFELLANQFISFVSSLHQFEALRPRFDVAPGKLNLSRVFDRPGAYRSSICTRPTHQYVALVYPNFFSLSLHYLF